MSDILALATAGVKPEQINDPTFLHYPRVDYLELKRYINLDVLDYTVYSQSRLGDFLRKMETSLHSDLYLTWLGVRNKGHYRLIFAMSERAGIPFAGLRKVFPSDVPFVSMFTCWSPRQEAVITKLGLFSTMDAIIVKTSSLKRHFISLGAPADRIYVVPLGLDHRFFHPLRGVKPQPGLIFSLGETRNRDYSTLFRAVDGLPVDVHVAAAGSWYARQSGGQLRGAQPENITLGSRYSRRELKLLYAQAQLVVLPLRYELASAGATAVLEAMSMARPVITTRSPGILDYVEHGETAYLVEPGDPQALREAILYLLAHPAEARRLGENARERIQKDLNLDCYVERVAAILRRYCYTCR